MERKRLVVNYNNISNEVMEAIRKKYPLGYSNHVIKVKTQGEDFFYAITVDTESASYLVKVPVKIDTKGISDDEALEDLNDEKEAEDNFAETPDASESDE